MATGRLTIGSRTPVAGLPARVATIRGWRYPLRTTKRVPPRWYGAASPPGRLARAVRSYVRRMAGGLGVQVGNELNHALVRQLASVIA
jgi:hypothetical protein